MIPSQGKQKWKAKKKPKDTQLERPKKKERTNLSHGRKLSHIGSYFTHNPFNVAIMQIVKFNNNGKSRTNIAYQSNHPLYSRG